jgi:hypothetical protein
MIHVWYFVKGLTVLSLVTAVAVVTYPWLLVAVMVAMVVGVIYIFGRDL